MAEVNGKFIMHRFTAHKEECDYCRNHAWEMCDAGAKALSHDLEEGLEMRRVREAVSAFHAHLDVCQQCREHVFDLCETGRILLTEGALDVLGDAGGVSPPKAASAVRPRIVDDDENDPDRYP